MKKLAGRVDAVIEIRGSASENTLAKSELLILVVPKKTTYTALTPPRLQHYLGTGTAQDGSYLHRSESKPLGSPT